MSDTASTIASLELEILSSSQSAETGLDALATSLGKLKLATKGGLGLTSVAKQIKGVSEAVNGINPSSTDNLKGLTQAIETLSKVGGFKISASIGNQITNISTALQGANFDGGAEKMQSLVTALAPLQQLQKSNLSSIVTPLKNLPKVFTELSKIDMTAFSAKIKEVATALKPLGDEMQKVANGFSAFPAKIQKLITNTNNLATANNNAAGSYINLYAKLKMAMSAVKTITTKIASWITLSSRYTETMNLFTVSMGQYAEEAYNYANKVGDAMGIDPAEWMEAQATIMTLVKGFGVAGDRANTMSQQLTQLGYDLASFRNISVADAMTKLESGIAGELEPLRRLGYDLSNAKLEAVALSLGIDKTVSSMTQAEKAELRYYAIMTQVTDAHHDMARTLDAPANQLRILNAQVTQLGRALGNFFIPILNKVLPYAIGAVKVLREMLDVFMGLLGIELAEVDWGSDSITSATEDITSNLEDSIDNAKKLKSYMLGFDELNVINTDDGSNLEDVLGTGFDFELPTYDFMEGMVATQIDEIVAKMKEWLGITDGIKSWADLYNTKLGEILTNVGLIGAGIAAWKVSKGLITAIDKIKKLTGTKIKWGNILTGVTLFLQDLTTLKEYMDDYANNGSSFETVVGILSTFAGMIGDACILLGKVEIGGALKTVEGVGQIVSAIVGMSKDGVNFDGITDAINGISNVVIGIGALSKNWAVLGIGMTLQGITTVIGELGDNWEAIKKGDWSGVDKAALVIGVVEAIGGIVTALATFKKLKATSDIAGAATSIGEVATVTETVSTTTSTLTTKLATLVKDLGLGIAIIAEVVVAAGLIVGAIWGLGELLAQVGTAWQPVIDNGNTVAIAVGIGTGILVAVGVASAALGSIGTTLVANIALGTAMLALTGVNAALFLAEIWAIGKGLDEIGKAWQPVLDNGEDIAKAIGIGTALLLGIGVVSAALGALTMATGGTVALAMAAGTAMLVLIGVDAALFLAEVKIVGDLLDDIGKAWKPVLDNGEDIAKAIKTGTGLLVGIGTATAALGGITIASVGTLPIAIAIGTAVLSEVSESFEDFVDSMVDIANQLHKELHPALSNLVNDLPTLTTNMGNFTSFMGNFADKVVSYTKSSVIAGISATVDKVVDFFTTDPIKRLANEVNEQYNQASTLLTNLTKANPKIKEAVDKLKEYNTLMEDFESAANNGSDKSGVKGYILNFAVGVINESTKWWDNVKSWWNQKVGAVNPFTTSVTNNSSTWWSNVAAWWNTKVGTVSNFNTNVKDDSYTWWNNVKSWWSTDSKNGVDVKVNALKGWSGSLLSTLGIPSALSLGFNLPRIRVKWSEKEVLGFKITFPSGFETYAQGGFPDVGQMFIAREAGPELVGNIGGRTAVANNDQIVESVSAGVYQAVLAALGSGNDDEGNTNIVINLDGEKIYENQQRIARGRGYNLGMGAFSFG